MIAEFKEFLLKTNALALAVGVIIGVALGNVVGSLVNDIIMPPIGVLLGGVDFAALAIELKAPDAATEDPGVFLRWGAFLNTIISFVVIALVVFMIGKVAMKPAPEAPAPAMKDCPFCKESVLDGASKCKFCGSQI